MASSEDKPHRAVPIWAAIIGAAVGLIGGFAVASWLGLGAAVGGALIGVGAPAGIVAAASVARLIGDRPQE